MLLEISIDKRQALLLLVVFIATFGSNLIKKLVNFSKLCNQQTWEALGEQTQGIQV